MLDDYVFKENLGSGSVGKVKLATDTRTNRDVAVKIIHKSLFAQSPDLKRKIQREIALMRLMNHTNVLSLLDVVEDDRNIYLIEQYAAHGSLWEIVPTIPLETSMHFFRQIIYGLEYLHQHSICHRDLKPENLLLDANNQLIIADFGFARWMPTNLANSGCGSPHYTAPEVISGKPYDGRLADIWSSGVILYAMVTKKLPFYDESIRVTIGKVKRGEYEIPSDVPEPVADLISRILCHNAADRIRINEIKCHPAFRMGLPAEYSVPKPLPLPNTANPIAVSLSDNLYVRALEQIGFADVSELMQMLNSHTPNMAKVFFMMVARPFDPHDISWDKLNNPDEDSSPIVAHPFVDPMDYGAENSDPCEPVFELPCPACEWLPPITNVMISEQEQTIRNLALNHIGLMTILQRFLTESGFLWCYPNDRTIIVRYLPSGVYATLIGQYNDHGTIELVVKMCRGTNEQFQAFFEALRELLGAWIYITEHIQLPDVSAVLPREILDSSLCLI